MLRRLVVDGKADYFAVVFDAPGRTFRDDWYPQYKATRQPMPDSLGQQIGPLHELIRAHGWPLLMVDRVEADDVIGTLVCKAEAQGIESLVSTGDKDLAQLVTPHVTLVNTMSNEKLDEAGVIAKFGVRPEQVLDLLTLTGDAIDNVPGVSKVGPKTAAKWLEQYGSLQGVIEHASEIGGVVGENLRAVVDWLPQARKLLTIRTDCSLPFEPKDLVIQPIDAAHLRGLYERFEFRQWINDIETGKGSAALPSGSAAAPPRTQPRPRPEREYATLLDSAAFDSWLAAIEASELACFGVHSNGGDPMQAQLVGLSFAIEPGRAAYLPLAHRYAGAPAQLSPANVLPRLKRWFESPRAKKLGHNLKYAEHVLANHGIALAGVSQDTVLQSYLLESHRPHELGDLALRHLEVRIPMPDEITGKGASRIAFEQVAVDRAAEYAAQTADVTVELDRVLGPRIAADPELAHLYEAIEMPTREVLFRMERTGVLIDTRLLAEQSRQLGERLVGLEQQAFHLAGGPFNPGSPKQLGEILFERMKLPVVKKTATGQPSTDEDVLEALAADYPLPKLLLEHRALSKLKSTYTDKLPQMVNARTGRVHTSFGQATAVTGRLASTDPNLQNIPVRTAEGRRIREAFVAPPGHVLMSADYSQVELRIMAHLSGDESLTRAFAAGEDIHRVTAAEVFSIPIPEVTSEQRRYIKAVNFGLIYGMSAFGLAAQLNIERAAAQAFIDRYFARYPGVADYMQRTRELARSQGFVKTVFGRRLWLPDINAGGGPRRQAAERAAINAPMQGTAADLVKLAMVAVQSWLDREALASRLILQVHDELVFEVPDAETPRLRSELPKLMSSVAALRVPLVVDIGVGPNWDRAH